ncbi:OmpA family protein [Formosa sp. A9]|uniref:OmpA family protein n=1 Tax=Formosa sp. A9 TaxID=3442641 RepID=UPI003EBF067C
MKNIYCLLGAVLTTTFSVAQNGQTQKADQLFESYQFADAASAYQKLVDNKQADAYVYKKLADAYYQMDLMDDAAKYYALATTTDQDPETYFRYAQALKAQGNYNGAQTQMEAFAAMQPEDSRAVAHVQNPGYVSELSNSQKLFDVYDTAINSSDNSDFSPVLTDNNELYFTSNRGAAKKADQWADAPYMDIYKAIRNSDGSLTDPVPVKSLNTPYHDGPVTLSQDGNTIIFSRDGHSEKSFKKISKNSVKLAQQGLYKATLVDGKWTDIKPLPFNSKDYTVTHPSLSADGKTLFFASDMPGGMGDVDIWMVSVDGDTYGTPENLGPEVNTPAKEVFPFIGDNHILYFASNGKQGLGGLDIFKIDLSKKGSAINLGLGINSKSDDFGLFLNSGLQVGYFASNRSGVDNIYGATPVCNFNAIAKVFDAKTQQPIAGAQLVLNGATLSSDALGNAEFENPCGNYTLTVSKMGYETASFNVQADNTATLTIEAPLQSEEVMITETEVKLAPIYFEFDKSDITPQGAAELDKLVRAMNKYPELDIMVRSHTDTKGNKAYNLKLSEKRANATLQYIVSKGIDTNRLSAKGMGSSQPKIDCQNCSKEQDALNRRSEFLIVK